MKSKSKKSPYITHYNVFLILLLFLTIFSCKSNRVPLPKEVEAALVLAEGNQKELEKVIRYFSKHEKDSLKLKSAYFLISNMPFHTSLLVNNESTCLMPFIELADKKLYKIFKDQPLDSLESELFKNKVEVIGEIIQSKMKKKTFEEKISIISAVTDIKIFSSDFLINHIENAFSLRETPIVNSLSFDDFCEYILPYRLVEYKNITRTGKDYNSLFYKYLKTKENNENDIMRTLELFKLIIKYFREILGDYPYNNKMGFEELFFNTPGYDCYDMVNTQGLILNACGIPVKAIFNLSFKNRSGSHAFLSLHEKYTNIGGFIPEDYVPGEKPQYFPGYAERTNFYQIHFSPFDTSPTTESNEDIPIELNNQCIEDVSSLWCPIDTIKLPFKKETENKFAYLATFSGDYGVICTTWGKINKQHNYVEFANVLPNTLYFPVHMNDHKLKLFAPPFYYKVDSLSGSSFTYFDGKKETLDSVNITRKYPIKPRMIERAKRLVGITVVASDNADFQKADTLYEITKQPGIYYQDMVLNNNKAFKYYKIDSSDETPYITITEIEYLTKSEYGYQNVTAPTPLSVFNCRDIKLKTNSSLVKIVDTCIHSEYAEYDGDEMTARRGVKKIVLNLTNPQIIHSIRFVPMNAHNGVYAKNQYTLFVWGDNRWEVIGNQTTEYNYLLFRNLKTNTLYWLKNRTEGREELPFLLDNKGVQKFIYHDIN